MKRPLGTSRDFNQAFMKETGWDATDWVKARFMGLEMSERDVDESHLKSKLGRHPAIVRTRSALEPKGKFSEALERLGMQNENRSVLGQAGQMLGTAASDIRDDGVRSWWWLINAIPATSSLLAESAFRAARKGELNKINQILDEQGGKINVKKDPGKIKAIQEGYATGNIVKDERGRPKEVEHFALKADIQSQDGGIGTRQYKGGHIAALTLPQAFAVNTAMGLMNPFGGTGGYEAALPSEDDPTRSANVVAEVGAKYLLGRTGSLLPYNEFVQHRPDVSRGEYNKYKAFKYDKNTDTDLSDGDFTMPMGVLKGTMEGIHGPELQFLGKSLPLTTGIIPYVGAVGGGLLGAIPSPRGKLVRNMLMGSIAGTAIGMGGGNRLKQSGGVAINCQ